VVDMMEPGFDLLHQRRGKKLALATAHLNAPGLFAK
jgi:hypothetical protein